MQIHKQIKFNFSTDQCLFPPTPAIKNIPDWYKNTPSYSNPEIGKKFSIIDNERSTSHTIKKCMPIYDAMTAGYILYTQVDVQVEQRNGSPYYSWAGLNAISFHPVIQTGLYPNLKNNYDIPKWNLNLTLETSKGYSCLFINPMHNTNNFFTIFPGIVDTDVYVSNINFPFTLNNPNWEGIIPAGTPVAQVIPFKRDSWKNEVTFNKKNKKRIFANLVSNSIFFNGYKKYFWIKKEYG